MIETHKLDTQEQVFFYEQDFYILSNFSSFALAWRGHRFDTAEAVYHWEKFSHPSLQRPICLTVAEMIRVAPSAHEAY